MRCSIGKTVVVLIAVKISVFLIMLVKRSQVEVEVMVYTFGEFMEDLDNPDFYDTAENQLLFQLLHIQQVKVLGYWLRHFLSLNFR